MSDYGAGLTLRRVDDTTIDEAEAQKQGSVDDGQADCGLGWPEDDAGYTLVATRSQAYTLERPVELSEAAMADDLAFALWLGNDLERLWPGRSRHDVESQEWYPPTPQARNARRQTRPVNTACGPDAAPSYRSEPPRLLLISSTRKHGSRTECSHSW